MKIAWSPLAAERWEVIYDYISVDNKAAAKKYSDYNKFQTLITGLGY